MDTLSNLFLRGFDVLLQCMLPFLLLGFFLMMAGRKPDAAIDAGFGLFSLILGGAAKLIGFFFKTLGQALFAAQKPKYVPGKYPTGKSGTSKHPNFAGKLCHHCDELASAQAAFCPNCGSSLL
jgi:hypothetical protein